MAVGTGFKWLKKNRRSPDAISPEGTTQWEVLTQTLKPVPTFPKPACKYR
jgi:hypothetical protein